MLSRLFLDLCRIPFWQGFVGPISNQLVLSYSQALRYIIRNTSLPQRTRAQAQLQLSQMHAYTRPTQIKNRCVAGGIARSVIRDFRIARVSNFLQTRLMEWQALTDIVFSTNSVNRHWLVNYPVWRKPVGSVSIYCGLFLLCSWLLGQPICTRAFNSILFFFFEKDVQYINCRVSIDDMCWIFSADYDGFFVHIKRSLPSARFSVHWNWSNLSVLQ